MGEKWEREREWRECGQEKMCVREREREREREKWPARFILSRLLWMLNILGSFILYLALRVEGKQQLLNYLQHSRTKGGFASTVTLLSLSLSHTHARMHPLHTHPHAHTPTRTHSPSSHNAWKVSDLIGATLLRDKPFEKKSPCLETLRLKNWCLFIQLQQLGDGEGERKGETFFTWTSLTFL